MTTTQTYTPLTRTPKGMQPMSGRHMSFIWEIECHRQVNPEGCKPELNTLHAKQAEARIWEKRA